MLNELRHLARSLEEAQVHVEKRHPYLAEMPKGITFILEIAADGRVARCVERPFEPEKPRLMRIESGNAGESFPGFNLGFAKKKWNILEKCLRTFPARIDGCLSDVPDDVRAFADLVKRCAESKIVLNEFLNSFKEAVERGEGNLSPKAKTLIKNLDTKQVSVFLEVDRPGDYQYPITHPKTAEYWNRLLLAGGLDGALAQGGKGARRRSGRSSYGKYGEIATRLPQPTLPVLGKVTLFSMSAETPAQFRYGLVESGAFPVTKPEAEEMMNALITITRRERDGRTWRAVPRSAGKEKDLLIAFLDGRPETDALFATFFGDAAAADEAHAAGRFEEACRSVVRAVEGIASERVDANVRVLVLSKADPGRTKVISSEAYRPAEIKRAAESWREGARNIPPFDVAVPFEKGKEAERLEPMPPFPTEAMRVLNAEWHRGAADARDCVDAPGCSLADVHHVLVRADRPSTERLLGIAVRRLPALLVSLAAAQHKGSETEIAVRARKNALVAVSLLGILLHVLDRTKEVYMTEAPYSIGRLLSLVDQLHALYAKEVRKGMPNQLLGNSLMATALDRPRTALDLLAQRILPYQAWARISKGEKAGLAHWFLNEIGALSAAIHEAGVPERTTEADRAEMLLGYLARPQKDRTEKEVAA